MQSFILPIYFSSIFHQQTIRLLSGWPQYYNHILSTYFLILPMPMCAICRCIYSITMWIKCLSLLCQECFFHFIKIDSLAFPFPPQKSTETVYGFTAICCNFFLYEFRIVSPLDTLVNTHSISNDNYRRFGSSLRPKSALRITLGILNSLNLVSRSTKNNVH